MIGRNELESIIGKRGKNTGSYVRERVKKKIKD